MVTTNMVDVLLHPIAIYVLALGAGFLIPLFDRAHRGSAVLVFLFITARDGCYCRRQSARYS